MSARIAIILNPRSGSAPERGQLAGAIHKAGVVADIHCIPSTGALEWLTQIGGTYDVLVAAGGDGTVSSVAAVAATSGKTIGVIPSGTLNHFARDAGIPMQHDAALALLATRRTTLVDLGVVNDNVFINNASIGVYPRMVWERNQARQRGLPKPVASGVAVVHTWLELDTVTARLCVDSRELVRRSPFVVVGNGEYELEGLELGIRRTLTGGKLSLYVAPELGRFEALALPFRALFGRLKQHEKFEAWTATSVTLDISMREVSVAVDGEIMRLTSPLRFGVRRRALEVIVPAGAAGEY